MDEALYRLHAQREDTYWWWVAKNRIILSLIRRFAPPRTPASRALDIGCGAGAVLAQLAAIYPAVGVDASPLALSYARARNLDIRLGALPNDLPFTHADRFDVIVMSEVIEHIPPPDDRASIAAAINLLNPGGVLVCTVPAHQWLWSSHDDFNHHQRRYSRRDFAALFSALPVSQLLCSQYQCASMPLLLAARFAERARTALTGKPPPEPTVRPLPRPINWALRAAFEAEKHWLPHARLPWGSSLITVHRRTAPN